MQTIYPPSSSASALYGLGITNVSFGSQTFSSVHSLADAALPLTGDTNSPEAFRHNIHLVHQQVIRIQSLARTALVEILPPRLVPSREHAYRPGRFPTTAYTNELKDALQTLVEFLRQSGVGALPLLDATDSLPTEDKLMADLSKSIEHEYANYQRIQESSLVVLNLLNSAEHALRK